MTEAEHLEKVLEAADELAIPKKRIFLLDEPTNQETVGCRSWRELITSGEQMECIKLTSERQMQETPAGLFCTSGTTGLPKMASRSHWSFIKEAQAINETDRKPYAVS